jgi:hypothetical protein
MFAPPTSLPAAIAEPYHVIQYETVIKVFYDISNAHSKLKGMEKLCACNFIAMINANIGFWYRGYGEINKQNARDIVHQFMNGIFL